MIELIKKIKNKTKKRNVRIQMEWQREKDQIFFFFKNPKDERFTLDY